MTEEKEYLRIPGHVSVKEAAEMLGISYDRTYQHVRTGRLRSKKVGGKHMIPKQAIEDFKHNPPGRIRTEPPDWRIYNSRIKLLNTTIHLKILPGKEELFEQKIQVIRAKQFYKFTGTMERYIFKNVVAPDSITILLLWKDNEMPDEATQQRELKAFKDEFADVLDWETASYSTKEGIIYT